MTRESVQEESKPKPAAVLLDGVLKAKSQDAISAAIAMSNSHGSCTRHPISAKRGAGRGTLRVRHQESHFGDCVLQYEARKRQVSTCDLADGTMQLVRSCHMQTPASAGLSSHQPQFCAASHVCPPGTCINEKHNLHQESFDEQDGLTILLHTHTNAIHIYSFD